MNMEARQALSRLNIVILDVAEQVLLPCLAVAQAIE